MTDAQDLARRYLDLWQDYLAALLGNLSEPEFGAALDRRLLGARGKFPGS